jgi:hypothetical protein
MAKPAPRASAATIALYTKLVATVPGIELKGAAIPYTAVNGNMFSMIAKNGEIALRLPPAERDAFLAKYDSTLHEEYGVVREEYVMVPSTLLTKTKEISKHFAKSAEYARSLKPKPTTRAKKPAPRTPKKR